MRDLEKWTRAHDAGGWRYEFQCSNIETNYADIESSDDEDTAYDQSTRAGRQVEA